MAISIRLNELLENIKTTDEVSVKELKNNATNNDYYVELLGLEPCNIYCDGRETAEFKFTIDDFVNGGEKEVFLDTRKNAFEYFCSYTAKKWIKMRDYIPEYKYDVEDLRQIAALELIKAMNSGKKEDAFINALRAMDKQYGISRATTSIRERTLDEDMFFNAVGFIFGNGEDKLGELFAKVREKHSPSEMCKKVAFMYAMNTPTSEIIYELYNGVTRESNKKDYKKAERAVSSYINNIRVWILQELAEAEYIDSELRRKLEKIKEITNIYRDIDEAISHGKKLNIFDKECIKDINSVRRMSPKSALKMCDELLPQGWRNANLEPEEVHNYSVNEILEKINSGEFLF